MICLWVDHFGLTFINVVWFGVLDYVAFTNGFFQAYIFGLWGATIGK